MNVQKLYRLTALSLLFAASAQSQDERVRPFSIKQIKNAEGLVNGKPRETISAQFDVLDANGDVISHLMVACGDAMLARLNILNKNGTQLTAISTPKRINVSGTKANDGLPEPVHYDEKTYGKELGPHYIDFNVVSLCTSDPEHPTMQKPIENKIKNFLNMMFGIK